MKNRWGIGIAIFYISFVAVMVGFVMFSRGVNRDLVRDDYYQGDIEFQEKYDKLDNAGKLAHNLRVSFDKETANLILEFPKNMEKISGNILLYRPDDKTLDFKRPVMVGSDGTQIISLKGKKQGVWKVNIDWKGNGIKYFKEDEIYNK